MANTYGNSGNRWWVGLNVGSDQSTIFGTGSILSPNGYESLPSGDASDDAQFQAAALYNKALPAKPATISVQNVLWYNINGPYKTQAAANKAIPAIQKAHPAPGAVAQLLGGGQASAAANTNSCCLVQIPVLHTCLFSRTEARALVGGLILGAAGIIALIGLSLVIVEGFQRSGAGAAAGRSLETVGAGVAFVPGLEGAGLAVGAAGAATRRAGSREGAPGSLARRQGARETAAREAAARKAAADETE